MDLPTQNPISETLTTGSAAFASLWRAWMAQWTQPQLLRLADTYLGARQFHSSQMGGFATQRLRHPAPKAFLAIGYLNLAHARSLGRPAAQIEEAPDIGLPQKLPGHLSDLWEGREPLCDAEGVALGPTGLFQAFSGLLEVSPSPDRTITPDQAAEASQSLGRYLRKRFLSQGIDWVEQLPQLRTSCPAAEPLLMGQTVAADRLLHAMPKLATLASATPDELWAQIPDSMAT